MFQREYHNVDTQIQSIKTDTKQKNFKIMDVKNRKSSGLNT